MKKADKLFVNDVVEFLNDANGYAPTKKSVKILFNCLDYNDMGFRFAICKINKIVYVFKYYEKSTDEYLTILRKGEFDAVMYEDIITDIIRFYGYEHASVYIKDVILAIRNTDEVVVCSEIESAYESYKNRVTCEQFGYASTAELEQDTCYDNIDIEANHALKICIKDTEYIYKSGDRVMSNTYFAAQVCEYFNCKSKEIDGVYTYCPLRSYPVCDANAYCGIESAIFTYSGIYYAVFHIRNDIYELHRISDNTYNNMARLMIYDVYPHTTRWIVKTNLDVRQGQSKMLREDNMDICMMYYRKKIHDTRELEY